MKLLQWKRKREAAVGPLPDFVVVGVQKAGTTSLKANLREHPEIYMPQREVHFVDSNWKEGIDWYRARFVEGAGNVCGEKTPRYMTRRLWMKRLHEVVPDAKIVILLRDPAKRFFSQVNQDIQRDRLPDPGVIDEAYIQLEILDQPDRTANYVWRGRYLAQIVENVLPFYESDRIFIRAMDGWSESGLAQDLRARAGDADKVTGIDRSDFTKKLMADLQDFLGVSRWEPPQYQVSHVRPYQATVAPEAVARMRELYADDNARLFDFLGYEIPAWLDDLAAAKRRR